MKLLLFGGEAISVHASFVKGFCHISRRSVSFCTNFELICCHYRDNLIPLSTNYLFKVHVNADTIWVVDSSSIIIRQTTAGELATDYYIKPCY